MKKAWIWVLVLTVTLGPLLILGWFAVPAIARAPQVHPDLLWIIVLCLCMPILHLLAYPFWLPRLPRVRHLEAGYDIAFRAARQALLALGYAIKHSDKESGILVGKRMVEPKHQSLFIPSPGVFVPVLQDPLQAEEINLSLKRRSRENGTTLHIKRFIDGAPQIDREVVNRIWGVAQRECMIGRGIEIPEELEEWYQSLPKQATTEEGEAKEKQGRYQ